MYKKIIVFFLFSFYTGFAQTGNPADLVNVFLGSSGDHGQMSPSASYPFSMISLGPQTYPHAHMGYEFKARKFTGFTHTRLEGVGCMGSGGNILIRPVLNNEISTALIKKEESARPGSYNVSFENGIQAEMVVNHNLGVHHYIFPESEGQLFVDLSYALTGRFVKEEHISGDHTLQGFIDTKTTCDGGVYRIYYYIDFGKGAKIKQLEEHQFLIDLNRKEGVIQVGLSSVSEEFARKRISKDSFGEIRNKAEAAWNKELGRIKIEDENTENVKLFYSLLYRGLQAPFMISEADGSYRAIDGSLQKSSFQVYHGWALWDNYREQIPMLSLFYPERYRDIALSIANLYPYGKKDFATQHEPAPTVRTEHAIVVLADALSKGVKIPVNSIKDSLQSEVDRISFTSPDKALEASYDYWAFWKITGQQSYKEKALRYKGIWQKDFADLTQKDVDAMGARQMYQGTIWQYRWLVPYDVQGLKKLAGGEEKFLEQLDRFFEGDYYNHANQPDLQVPGLYNATSQPWKSQKLYHDLLLGEVNQFYFNGNGKGVEPYIGRIYRNQPQAYLRTMDDDLGTMSSWFVLRSLGLSAANVGEPVFYLTAPIFKRVTIYKENGKELILTNQNRETYIHSLQRDGNAFNQNWINYQDFINSQSLNFSTGKTPDKTWGTDKLWITKTD